MAVMTTLSISFGYVLSKYANKSNNSCIDKIHMHYVVYFSYLKELKSMLIHQTQCAFQHVLQCCFIEFLSQVPHDTVAATKTSVCCVFIETSEGCRGCISGLWLGRQSSTEEKLPRTQWYQMGTAMIAKYNTTRWKTIYFWKYSSLNSSNVLWKITRMEHLLKMWFTDFSKWWMVKLLPKKKLLTFDLS